MQCIIKYDVCTNTRTHIHTCTHTRTRTHTHTHTHAHTHTHTSLGTYITYMKRIEDGVEPCENCSILIDSKQSKHPCQAEQGKQYHQVDHEISAVIRILVVLFIIIYIVLEFCLICLNIIIIINNIIIF